MLEFLKCGSKSMQSSAMIIAILDVICTSILLILFVLGSSIMLAFEIIGKPKNATRILDIVTDDVFGQVQKSYDYARENKDVAEDMGVWLIIMFLTIVDFIISCIFLDGVKTQDANKCQVWLNIRLVIIVVFKIIVLINLVYGTSLLHAIPDMIFTLYRLLGLYIGYSYLKELQNPPLLNDEADDEDKMENGKEVKGNDSFTSLPSIAISSPLSPEAHSSDPEEGAVEDKDHNLLNAPGPFLHKKKNKKHGITNPTLQIEEIELDPKKL